MQIIFPQYIPCQSDSTSYTRLTRRFLCHNSRMQADLVRPRRRSNSTAGLASRLGTRGVVAGTQSPRRRLNRSNLPPQMRSNSRVAVARTNSQTRRSNSRGRLPAARDLSAQRQGPRQSRSVSRNRPNTPNLQTRRGAAAAIVANTRSRSRSRGRTAAAARGAHSVNARLGPNRTLAAAVNRQAAAGTARVIRGRVLKRRASNAGGVAIGPQGRRNASVGTAKQRLGRTRTRYLALLYNFSEMNNRITINLLNLFVEWCKQRTAEIVQRHEVAANNKVKSIIKTFHD